MDGKHHQIIRDAISGLEREQDRLQQILRIGEAEYDRLEGEKTITSKHGEALDDVVTRLGDALDELDLVMVNVRDAAETMRTLNGKAPR